MKLQKILPLCLLFSFALGGCNYRVFDLEEYPNLQANPFSFVPPFVGKPTDLSFNLIYQNIIVAYKCLDCHNPDSKTDANSVPLDTYHDLITADWDDPLVIPKDLDKSPFYKVLLATTKKHHMPPLNKPQYHQVSEDRIQVVRNWILKGAPEKFQAQE